MAKATLTSYTVDTNQDLIDIISMGGRLSTLTPNINYTYILEYTSNEPISMEHFPQEINTKEKSKPCPTLKLKFID